MHLEALRYTKYMTTQQIYKNQNSTKTLLHNKKLPQKHLKPIQKHEEIIHPTYAKRFHIMNKARSRRPPAGWSQHDAPTQIFPHAYPKVIPRDTHIFAN